MAMAFDLVKGDIRTQLDRLPESIDSHEKEEEDVVNIEDKEFPIGMEERNWAELPRDILSIIFKKIAAMGIIWSAQFVCRPWRLLSHEPELWRCIDMRISTYESILEYTDDMDVLKSMAMVAIDRSKGCLEDLYVEYFVSDEFMRYIARRSKQLRCLHLISVSDMPDMVFVQAVRRFRLLEDLEISICSFSFEVIESVGQACPQLKSFRLNMPPDMFQDYSESDSQSEFDTEALAIAKHMQQLRRLQLFGNTLTNIGLFAILDNCPYLEHLDIRRCLNVDFDEKLKKKCARIKDLRLPNDSTADYEYLEHDWPLFNVDSDSDYDYHDYDYNVSSEDDYNMRSDDDYF